MPDNVERSKEIDEYISECRATVRGKLEGFTADFPKNLHTHQMTTYKPDRGSFPVPDLVFFMLRNVMGWKWTQHGEKERWCVYGSVAGNPVFFALRKFGFTIGYTEDGKELTKRIEGQLQSALKKLETFLEPIAQQQISQGEVSVANRFIEFNNRYLFFRQLADESFRRSSEKPTEVRAKGEAKQENPEIRFVEDLMEQWNHDMKANRDGFFHSVAMVDCYFSALEHRLILLRAFTGKLLAEGEFQELLSAKWDEKLKMVADVSGSRQLALTLGQMRDIKTRVRNPFSHGGVENDKGSIFFHLPTVGAIPGNLTQFGNSVRFSFLPVEPVEHAEYTKVFDELDDLLSTGSLDRPDRLMKAGIDPSFDPNTVGSYLEAISGTDEQLEEFVESWSRMWEQHTNMDY